MEMTEEFLETTDLDWFASCESGLIVHFTTAGRGFVPEGVRKSFAEHEELCDFFQSMVCGAEVEIFEKNLPIFNDCNQCARYLKDFVEVASKGVFSYDSRADGGYKLVAAPKEKIWLCTLPKRVRDIIHTLSIDPVEDVVVSVEGLGMRY